MSDAVLDAAVSEADFLTVLAEVCTQRFAGGNHTLVPGVVEQAIAAPGAPLAYHRRVFGTHSEFVGSLG
jgi:hypothetical protein